MVLEVKNNPVIRHPRDKHRVMASSYKRVLCITAFLCGCHGGLPLWLKVRPLCALLFPLSNKKQPRKAARFLTL